VERCSDFNAQESGIKGLAIKQNNTDTVAQFVFIHTARGSEVLRAEGYAEDFTFVQISGQFPCIDPGSAEDFKRGLGPPSHAHI